MPRTEDTAAIPRCAITAPRRCRSHSCALDARLPPTAPRTARSQKTGRPCNKGCHRLLKRTALHLAAYYGHLNVVQTIFGFLNKGKGFQPTLEDGLRMWEDGLRMGRRRSPRESRESLRQVGRAQGEVRKPKCQRRYY
jgi:hypothetical protein